MTDTELWRRVWPFTQSDLSRTGDDLRRDGAADAIVSTAESSSAKLYKSYLLTQALCLSLPHTIYINMQPI